MLLKGEKKLKIAITGSTGNMGQETLAEILKLPFVEKIKLLVLPEDKRINKLLKKHKPQKNKIEVVFGNLAEKTACQQLVKDVDYVINMAAVIPPHSDQHPEKAVECNQIGVDTLVSAIEELPKQPKLIHISTVALYGNRNYLHPWGRVGDPLLVSPFDIYSATKLRGEFRVLESSIKEWVVLRQTAMLHKNMLSDNMSDGLMFHTCFNAPLEWVTAHDSGVLIANIFKEENKNTLGENFWKKVFNIGGGQKNRITGFDTLNDGFKLIGGSAKDFFQPTFNATRNFHGVWFYDGSKLDELFHYQTQDTAFYWNEIKKSHKYYSLAKIVPKSWISVLAIQRLFKSPNSPYYWKKHNDKAKMIAYFKGEEAYDSISKNWKNFNLLVENRNDEGRKIEYEALRNIKNAKLIDLGFDYSKDDNQITIEDLKSVAKEHGGKLLSNKFNKDMYEKLQWETQDGEKFEASAFSVLRAGHWYNPTYKENVWDFDRLSKKDKIFASLWLDSHDKNEQNYYYFDDSFVAKIK